MTDDRRPDWLHDPNLAPDPGRPPSKRAARAARARQDRADRREREDARLAQARSRITPAGALLGAVILALVFAVPALINAVRRPDPATPAAPVTPTLVSSAPEPTPTASPSASAEPGDADTTPVPVPPEALTTAKEFIAAWLDRNPDTRMPALRRVCVGSLADGLALTKPGKIALTTPVGDPQPIVEASGTTQVQTRQRLADGTTVRMLLVIDPAGPHGWLVQDISPE